jgi:hypothetical protein
MSCDFKGETTRFLRIMLSGVHGGTFCELSETAIPACKIE